MKKYFWISVLLFGLTLIGCKPSPETNATKEVTPFATQTAIPTQTETPIPSATPTRTQTPTSTQTSSLTPSPTATVSPIPTSEPQISIVKSFASSYSGVASYAPWVASFAQGMVINILGISPDANWLLIEIPPDQSAWIQKDDVEILNTEIELIVFEVTPPPTPTPTLPAPPRISVSIKEGRFGEDLIIEFINFQPREKIDITIYEGSKIFKHRSSLGLSDKGYGRWDLFRENLKKNVTYFIVADGSLGSHVEKTFSR